MDRIVRAQRSAREPAAAMIAGMDNLQAAAIQTGIGKLGHKYDAFVFQNSRRSYHRIRHFSSLLWINS